MPLVTWESVDGSLGGVVSSESDDVEVHEGMKFAVIDSPRSMVTVTVNGKKVHLAKRRYSYINLTAIAGFPPVTEGLTVTYSSDEESGTICAGEHIQIKAGMVINVAYTDDA